MKRNIYSRQYDNKKVIVQFEFLKEKEQLIVHILLNNFYDNLRSSTIYFLYDDAIKLNNYKKTDFLSDQDEKSVRKIIHHFKYGKIIKAVNGNKENYFIYFY